ncbi:MAG: metabolite traffic protein EboE [Deltaproteobacteria bacterium]|nr:metabolite traffic protein EboE [Deltaproteobacteria bacterium]
MKLAVPGAPHLTYCTNIHAGDTWPEVRANIARHVPVVKARVAPDQPFGVGLRLSASAAAALAAPAELEAFRALLAAHDLYVFTLNGFPYGAFHGAPVKERVYRPDWREDARLVYTDRLARILAALLPLDCEGSISTVPGAYKERISSEEDAAAIAARLAAHVATLHDLRERCGVTITLALEPEPCCLLETIAETVAFFEDHVWGRTVPGLDRHTSEEALRRHLGVCFDACHMAIEYEPPATALATLAAHGIRVAKVQVSAGLAATIDGADDLTALHAFADDVYLHQVVERSPQGLARYADLPAALDAAVRAPRRREWRVHFHVPLFRARLGRFASTQSYVRELLGVLRREATTSHLEVETYTWDVLPKEYRREPIADAIARELAWVVAEMSRA